MQMHTGYPTHTQQSITEKLEVLFPYKLISLLEWKILFLNPQRGAGEQGLISQVLQGLPTEKPGSPQTKFGHRDESEL